VRATVRVLAKMLANTTVNQAACAAAAHDPSLLATDLAGLSSCAEACLSDTPTTRWAQPSRSRNRQANRSTA